MSDINGKATEKFHFSDYSISYNLEAEFPGWLYRQKYLVERTTILVSCKDGGS
jgi:hypothetical protein